MSGGYFDYDQYRIHNIAESIESVILKNGRKKTEEEMKEEWYHCNPNHYKYSDEVIEKFKEAVILLKKASIYSQRIDYLLSDDDGEESFLQRLKEELEQL